MGSCGVGPSVPVVEAAVRGPVSWRPLSPGASSVLVARAGDETVHARWPRLFHADAAATAGETKIHQNIKTRRKDNLEFQNYQNYENLTV